jgi:hypothetical protein
MFMDETLFNIFRTLAPTAAVALSGEEEINWEVEEPELPFE